MSLVDRYKTQTLSFLTAALPFTSGVFYSVDRSYNAVDACLHTGGGNPDQERERYEAHFYRLDPFHPRRFANSATSLVTLRDVMEVHSYAKTQYYRDFIEPLGLLYEAELFLRERGAIVGGIALIRDCERHDFNARELAFLRAARPMIESGFTACRRASTETQAVSHPVKLSARERDVVELVCAGASNGDICRELHISLPTVKTHLHNVFRKTGVRSRTQLVAAVRPPHGAAD